MTRSFYPKIARQEKTSMEQEEPEQNGLGEGLHILHPLAFVEGGLFVTPVIGLRCRGTLVVGELLGLSQHPVIDINLRGTF